MTVRTGAAYGEGAVAAADVSGVCGRPADVVTATARSVVDSELLGTWL
ncbi:hypothetical protein ACWC3X_41760 [Streptomyces populi]